MSEANLKRTLRNMVNFYTRKVTGNKRNFSDRAANSRTEGNLAKAFKEAFIKRLNNVSAKPQKKRRFLRQ
jgi:hypothetical protein